MTVWDDFYIECDKEVQLVNCAVCPCVTLVPSAKLWRCSLQGKPKMDYLPTPGERGYFNPRAGIDPLCPLRKGTITLAIAPEIL